MSLEQITEEVAFHGEGPVWHESWGGLRWLDMLAGDILTLHASGVSRLHIGSPVAAFVRPRASGGYIVGTERGIALSDTVDGAPTQFTDVWSDPNIRMNEGGIDPNGRLYAGSLAYDRTPGGGQLYRIAGDEIETIFPAVTTSNGIEFTADATRAYYNETGTRRTDVFDVDEDGNLVNRRLFHSSDGASPDGLAVDSQGNVWCAMNHAGTVRLYSPEAEILGEWSVPCPSVTAVTLGGDDRKDVFVTTSKENADVPGAGAVFHMRADVAGQPTKLYAY